MAINKHHYYNFGFDRYYTETVESFKQAAEYLVDEWRDSLQEALSKELPIGQESTRTFPRNRLFPYMRTGILRDSVEASVTSHISHSGKSTVVSVTGQVGTDNLYRGTTGASDAGWFGWMEDVLERPNGRGNVPSLESVFGKVHNVRRRFQRNT